MNDETNDHEHENEELDSAVPSDSPDDEETQAPSVGGGAAGTSSTPSSTDPLSQGDQELVDSAANLKKDIDRTYIKLARILHEIFRKKIYRKRGFNTEEEFASKVLRMHGKKVQRLRRIHEVFVERLGYDEDTVAGITFTSAALLAGVITPATSDTWLQKARELSSRELEQEIGAATGRGTARDDRRVETYRFHRDQWSVVQKALEVAAHHAARVGGHSPEERIANICLHYCSTHALSKSNPEASVTFYLSIFESLFGGKFFWLKNESAAQTVLQAMKAQPDLIKDGGKEFRPPNLDQSATTNEPREFEDGDGVHGDVIGPPNQDNPEVAA